MAKLGTNTVCAPEPTRGPAADEASAPHKHRRQRSEWYDLLHMHRRARRNVGLLGIVIGGLVAASCNPPAAVANFASVAGQTVTRGGPVYEDIHDSCLRRQADEAHLQPEYLNPSAQFNGACASLVPAVQEAQQAASVLANYFRAMQQLAAFDESQVSTQAMQTGASLSTAAVLSANQVDAVSKLSGLITEVATRHYRRAKLRDIVTEADPHIAAVTQGLETVITKDYAGLLDEEQRALNRRYRLVHRADEPATVLLLNRAYTQDMAALQRRREAARAYASALKEIRDAHHDIAQKAGQLGSKQTALALQPYISQLQAAAPKMQEAR